MCGFRSGRVLTSGCGDTNGAVILDEKRAAVIADFVRGQVVFGASYHIKAFRCLPSVVSPVISAQ